MLSIVFLPRIGKEKRGWNSVLYGSCFLAAMLFSVSFLSVWLGFPKGAVAAEGGGAVVFGTQNENKAVFGVDPATGMRVMRTPEPASQSEYQGPQTIVVVPEVRQGGVYPLSRQPNVKSSARLHTSPSGTNKPKLP